MLAAVLWIPDADSVTIASASTATGRARSRPSLRSAPGTVVRTAGFGARVTILEFISDSRCCDLRCGAPSCDWLDRSKVLDGRERSVEPMQELTPLVVLGALTEPEGVILQGIPVDEQ